jgi:hypothetical protein
MSKKLRSRFGMNIPDHISESLEWVKILKFFDANSKFFLTLDPGSTGWKKFGSGTNVPDPQLLLQYLRDFKYRQFGMPAI